MSPLISSSNLDDQPVKSLEHDGVLRAEVVGGQALGLPVQPLVGVGQELGAGEVRPFTERDILKIINTKYKEPTSIGVYDSYSL